MKSEMQILRFYFVWGIYFNGNDCNVYKKIKYGYFGNFAVRIKLNYSENLLDVN